MIRVRRLACVWCKRPLNWWVRLIGLDLRTQDGAGPLCWRHYRQARRIIDASQQLTKGMIMKKDSR